LNETAVSTGDTRFINGVGRPDLHADPEAVRQRAAALFTSLDRLRQLPPKMVLLPAHASEPIAVDGQPVAARLDEVATTWLSEWIGSESVFVERVASKLPPTPPNFVRIGEDSFPLTQEFMAQMLGVRRPTVNLTGRSLQRAGFIRYTRGKITVVDRKGLEEAS
jgi:CRP-like cAMP-binding protein